jgi:hypothetical protein
VKDRKARASCRTAGYGNVTGFRVFLADVCMEKALRVEACYRMCRLRVGDAEPYPDEFVNLVWVAPEWASAEGKARAVEWMILQGLNNETYKMFHTIGVNLAAEDDYTMMGIDFRRWHAENGMGG